MKAAPKIANLDRPAPRRKTASGDFFENPNKCTYRMSPQALKTCREQIATITTTASGLPCWPSRDPIEETDDPDVLFIQVPNTNLYSFVKNQPVNAIDLFGLQFHTRNPRGGGIFRPIPSGPRLITQRCSLSHSHAAPGGGIVCHWNCSFGYSDGTISRGPLTTRKACPPCGDQGPSFSITPRSPGGGNVIPGPLL